MKNTDYTTVEIKQYISVKLITSVARASIFPQQTTIKMD